MSHDIGQSASNLHPSSCLLLKELALIYLEEQQLPTAQNFISVGKQAYNKIKTAFTNKTDHLEVAFFVTILILFSFISSLAY